MATEAGRHAAEMLWPAVADQYRSLGTRLLANRTPVLG